MKLSAAPSRATCYSAASASVACATSELGLLCLWLTQTRRLRTMCAIPAERREGAKNKWSGLELLQCAQHMALADPMHVDASAKVAFPGSLTCFGSLLVQYC